MSRKSRKAKRAAKKRTNQQIELPEDLKSIAQVRHESTEKAGQKDFQAALRIGIVVHRHVLPQTMTSCWAVNRMVQGGAELDIHALAYVDIGRNQIATKALKAGNPMLLFVDFDMDFPPQTVGLMKEALDKDPDIGAIAAHYIKWDGSAEAMAHWRTEDGKAWIKPQERDDRVAKYTGGRDVVEVDRFGTGCMLVRTEVLTKIPYPWFQLWFHEDYGHVGEDVHFCWMLKNAGYHPSVHFGAPAGHIGPTMWVPFENSGRGGVAVHQDPNTINDVEDVPDKPKITGHPVAHQVGGPKDNIWPSETKETAENDDQTVSPVSPSTEQLFGRSPESSSEIEPLEPEIPSGTTPTST